jgi:hypothetical protein
VKVADQVELKIPPIPKLSSNASNSDIVNVVNQINSALLLLSGQQMPTNNLSTETTSPSGKPGAVSRAGGATMQKADNARASNAQGVDQQKLLQRRSSFTEVGRDTEKVRVTNPNDDSQYVDIERINRLTMRNNNTGELWVWYRKR